MGNARDPAKREREDLVIDQPILVSLVDDDESVRESVPDLLQLSGFSVRAFSSAQEFLGSDVASLTRCLILDVAMPEMSGPELLLELRRRGQQIPIVFITAPAEDTIRSHLMALGAVECLFKPFSEEAILEALGNALRGKGA
jgi:FixJ family two-component response regulator